MPAGYAFSAHVKAVPVKKQTDVTTTGDAHKLVAARSFKGADAGVRGKQTYKGLGVPGNGAGGKVGGVAGKLSLLRQFEKGTEGRGNTYGRAKEEAKDANKSWTNAMDDELTIMYGDGVGLAELAEHFGRTKGAVQMRIRKLGLE